MTELDAINRMLRYIGELPVPNTVSIDSLPEGHEAVISRTILKEVSREVQQEGWWFNKYKVRFVPDVGGKVVPPFSVVSIDSDKGNYVLDGGAVFDKKRNSFLFTEPFEANVRYEREFPDVPDVCKTYIVLLASQDLHVYLNGDASTQESLRERVSLQRVKLERENLRQSGYNLVKGGRVVSRDSSPVAIT